MSFLYYYILIIILLNILNILKEKNKKENILIFSVGFNKSQYLTYKNKKFYANQKIVCFSFLFFVYLNYGRVICLDSCNRSFSRCSF